MKEVFVLADNIISPLGITTDENFHQLCQGISAIKEHYNPAKSSQPFFASLFDPNVFNTLTKDFPKSFTCFEKLLALSISKTFAENNININTAKTALIISSTKGNIGLIEKGYAVEGLKKSINFSSSARKIASLFNITTKPLIVSHACISGVVALNTARRLLSNGCFENIIVTGADVITRFILSGFQSFYAISNQPCMPFDANRNGLNLGEAAATLILSTHKPVSKTVIQFLGGATSNDANHISGPSRTGKELQQAIEAAITESEIQKSMISFISAHGTATIYNDDMESKAFHGIGLEGIPVNSLKGFFGHTLGAAGLVETVISIQSLKKNKIIPTKGFHTAGTAKNITICNSLLATPCYSFLKTASGFGGCNAAAIFKKNENNN